ncbi:hypothetical protein JW824_13875 [bacterium]|nr:hypothetical protein [bacterium]
MTHCPAKYNLATVVQFYLAAMAQFYVAKIKRLSLDRLLSELNDVIRAM